MDVVSHGESMLGRMPTQSGGGAPSGERKVATVMFVDMARSSRLIFGQDPEEAEERLLALLQLMVDSVHRYGGTVNQVLGDGVMALFGAPDAQEDHALRACLAAESVHRSMAEIVDKVRSSGLPAMEARVGISSGELVITDAGRQFGLKHRAVGEAVYQAQRMEAVAPPGGTVLSRRTAALAAGQIKTKSLGAVRPGPDAEPIESLQLTEINLTRQRFERLSESNSRSFIGRHRDLSDMRAILSGVEAGRGQALIVTGEAGIGKSRLVFEFLETLADKRVRVVTCNLLPIEMARPLAPMAQVVRSLLPPDLSDCPGGSLDDGSVDDVAAFLASLAIRGQHAAPAIMDVLGLAVDQSTWGGLDPPERLQIAVETVGQLCCALGRGQPLVMVLEDFQWADSETRMFADSLANQLLSSSVLMIVTCRSHQEKFWADWPRRVRREIERLSRSQTAALLEIRLGPEPQLEEFKALLSRNSQGNPFFIEECIKALEESGKIVGSPGDYKLEVPVSALEIPATVHGVLAARIDSLPPPEKSTLLSASIIGQRVDVALLREMEDLTREETLARLSGLQQAGFLDRTRVLPNLEYSFRHSLIHDVAYNTILKKKCRQMHRALMANIETRRTSQLSGKLELLAHHAYQGEEWAKALAYCRRAGLRAQARSANREAVNFFERALVALGHLPDTRRNRERAVDLRLELVQSLFPLGDYEQVRQHLLAAQERVRAKNDGRRWANVISTLVAYHWITGSMDRAAREGAKALAMAKRFGDRKCAIQAATRLGGIEVNRGNYLAACNLLETTFSSISRSTSYDRFGLFVVGAVANRATLACALGQLGEFEQAIKVGGEGIRIAEESGHAFSQIYANLFYSHVLLRKGDFLRSQPSLLRSFELCDALKAKLLYPMSAASLGYAYVRSGKIAQGLELLQKAARTAEKHAVRHQLSNELTWLGEAYLLAGDTQQASILAREALELGQRVGAKGDEAWTLWLLGEICAERDPSAYVLAESYLEKALGIALERDMKPLVAHINLSLGRIHNRHRDGPKARSKLLAAMTHYQRLDMRYWLEMAEREYVNLVGEPAYSSSTH